MFSETLLITGLIDLESYSPKEEYSFYFSFDDMQVSISDFNFDLNKPIISGKCINGTFSNTLSLELPFQQNTNYLNIYVQKNKQNFNAYSINIKQLEFLKTYRLKLESVSEREVIVNNNNHIDQINDCEDNILKIDNNVNLLSAFLKPESIELLLSNNWKNKEIVIQHINKDIENSKRVTLLPNNSPFSELEAIFLIAKLAFESSSPKIWIILKMLGLSLNVRQFDLDLMSNQKPDKTQLLSYCELIIEYLIKDSSINIKDLIYKMADSEFIGRDSILTLFM